MKKLLTFIGLVLLLGAGTFAYASSFPVGGQTYFLAGAGVNATQNTIQLSSFTTADGRSIAMSNFGTIGYAAIEPQTSSKIEDISFTGITQNANGTATLTGVTRGIDFLFPYASTNSLMKAHAGGAQFIITNTPEWYYNEFSMQNLSNVFTYPTASTSPATKGYVDQTAFSGAGAIQASFVAVGYSQLGTGVQAAASTVNGSAGVLVIPTSQATSTFNAATAANKVIVTGVAGTIDPNFLAIASTTPIGSVRGTDLGLMQQVFTGTGTSTWAVPSGVKLVRAIVQGGGSSGGSCSGQWSGASGGSAGGYANGIFDVSATTSIQYFVGTTAQWSTFGTNGFYESGNGGVNGSTGSAAGPAGGTAAVTAAGSSYTITGQNGGSGVNGNSTGAISLSGLGGSSPLGQGGTSQENTTGANGTGFGSGGGGGSCLSSAGANNGGTGTQGVVILQW